MPPPDEARHEEEQGGKEDRDGCPYQQDAEQEPADVQPVNTFPEGRHALDAAGKVPEAVEEPENRGACRRKKHARREGRDGQRGKARERKRKPPVLRAHKEGQVPFFPFPPDNGIDQEGHESCRDKEICLPFRERLDARTGVRGQLYLPQRFEITGSPFRIPRKEMTA